jgi:hypothetical protein
MLKNMMCDVDVGDGYTAYVPVGNNTSLGFNPFRMG